MTKKALITGITGQDGSYLAEWLLSLGYEVHGLVRSTTAPLRNAEHIRSRISVQHGDICSGSSITQIIGDEQYDEIYNLAAQSHVGISFNIPETTFQTNAIGVLNLLEAIRRYSGSTKFYQASTSELFGDYPNQMRLLGGCNENTVMQPTSPYAIAKYAAHQLVELYRKAYGIYAVSGILFNHESPRRGENFVTRKITSTLAAIERKEKDKLILGNLSARRDWGFAPEYVQAMHKMLQQTHDNYRDFVIGTGESYSVHDFLTEALQHYKLSESVVETSRTEYRPSEVGYLKADAYYAENVLEWTPKVKFHRLIALMCAADSGCLDAYDELLAEYGIKKYWVGY